MMIYKRLLCIFRSISFVFVIISINQLVYAQTALTLNPKLMTSAEIDSIESNIGKFSKEEKINAYIKLAFGYKIKNPEKAVNYADEGIVMAKKYEKKSEEAQLLTEKGKAYNRMKLYVKEIEAHREALRIRTELNDNKGIATSLNYIGQAYFDNQNYSASMQSYLHAVEIFISIEDNDGIAITYNDLGIVNYYLGNLEPSLQYYYKALKVKEKIGNQISIATSKNNMADIYSDLENYDAAISILKSASEIFGDRKELPGKINSTIKLGDIFTRIGKYDSAKIFLENGLNEAVTSGNLSLTAFAHMYLGKLALFQSEYTEARSHYLVAKQIYDTLNSKRGCAEAENKLGYVILQLGKVKESIKLFDSALVKATELNAKKILQESYFNLSLAYKLSNDFKKAMIFYERYSEVKDSIYSIENKRRFQGLEAYFQSEQRGKEIEMLKKEQEKSSLIRNFLIVVVFLSVLFLIIVFRRYLDKRKMSRTLLIKNKLITEQSDKLIKSEKELFELNATKDKFFSIIAHDLRSPFAGFLGLTKLLSENDSSITQDRIKKIGEMLYSSASNIFDLLENLLNWSKMQRGIIPFNPELIEIGKIADENINLFLSKAIQKNIKLINDIPDGLEIKADKDMIAGIIRNLLSNALKFTNENGMIKFTASEEEGAVKFCIEDNGIGMSPELIEKLFRIDQKVTRKGSNNEDGSGLGLLLCYDYVKKHNGNIQVESRDNEGTKFCITIPRTN